MIKLGDENAYKCLEYCFTILLNEPIESIHEVEVSDQLSSG